MKKIALTAFAATAALTLAACGGADDASEDAMADTVEMPADEAMTDAAQPVEGTEAEAPAAPPAATVNAAADAADAAVADVSAAAEAATKTAEGGM